jgi:biotin transport system permease protein
VSAAIGLYHPGRSVLHRLPAGVKLGGLVLAGLCSIAISKPAHATAAVAVVLLLYFVADLPGSALLDCLRPLSWVIVPLGIFHTIVVGWERAAVIVGAVVALVLLAQLVTLTTRTSDLIEVVVGIARPAHRFGVNAERIGLVLNLAIRAVPLMVELATEVKQAQQARGRSMSPRAFAVPLVVGALHRADDLGDAVAARGFDD